MATAGSLSLEGGTLLTGRLRQSYSLTATPSEVTQRDDDDGGEVEDRPEVEEVNDIQEEGENDDGESVSGQSHNLTEIASVCTSISITGVDPLIAIKVCALSPIFSSRKQIVCLTN